MSTLAARLAAALEPISAEAKASLVKLLRAQIGPKTPRKLAKDNPLLDTRTVAELWLAGEMPDARNRAAKRAPKGAYRSIKVTLVDGFSIVAGSYLADDAAAKAEVVRFARSRAMEAAFAPNDPGNGVIQRILKASGAVGCGWQWVRLPDGSTRRTRACQVADVASVEFVPSEPAPASPVLMELRYSFAVVEGDYSLIDTAALARRAERLEGALLEFSRIIPTPTEESADVVPLLAPRNHKRIRGRSWVVYSPESFVAYVGPKRGIQAMLKSNPAFRVVQMPADWRTRFNPYPADHELAFVFDNARARIAGQRQRVRLQLAA